MFSPKLKSKSIATKKLNSIKGGFDLEDYATTNAFDLEDYAVGATVAFDQEDYATAVTSTKKGN